MYLYCPDGYGNTRLAKGFLETRWKDTFTTLNWKMTNELFRTYSGL